MGTKLLPGKGGHFHLNGDTLLFFIDVLGELDDFLGGQLLNEELDAGKAKELFENLKGAEGWSYEKDKFGAKVYREMAWQEGTYRVTCVLNSKDELKLDIRNWYAPEA